MQLGASSHVLSCLRAALLSPESVQRYRRDGFLHVEGVLPRAVVEALTAACSEVGHARGSRALPGMDDEHTGKVAVKAHMRAKQHAPSSGADAEAGTAELLQHQRLQQQQGEAQRLEKRFRKVLLRCRNQREVDRVYAKLSAQRERYMKLKGVPNFVSLQEEAAGRLGERRVKEVMEQYTYEDVKRSFEEYRDSGKMEMEIRHDYHVDDVMAHLQNWGRTWGMVWNEEDMLRRQLLEPGSVGAAIGEVAAGISGGVVVRLYNDAIYNDGPFSNAIPFHIAAASLNFRDPRSLTVMIGLDAPASSRGELSIFAGSHHVVRKETREGHDLSPFHSSAVFDTGAIVRSIPALKDLDLVTLPPITPGAVTLLNNYVVCSVGPAMSGKPAAYTSPTSPQIHVQPYQYAMALMFDRVTFDGRRTSWMSRDSHGPLYSLKPGDVLDNSAVFPILHRALDVE